MTQICCTIILLIFLPVGSAIVINLSPTDDFQQALQNISTIAEVVIQFSKGNFEFCPISIVGNGGAIRNLTLFGAGPDSTVVDCRKSQSRCLEILDSTINVINVIGIQFRNGVASVGGNIFVQSNSVRLSTINLVKLAIVGGSARLYGGGIAVMDSSSIAQIRIIDTVMSNNNVRASSPTTAADLSLLNFGGGAAWFSNVSCPLSSRQNEIIYIFNSSFVNNFVSVDGYSSGSGNTLAGAGGGLGFFSCTGIKLDGLISIWNNRMDQPLLFYGFMNLCGGGLAVYKCNSFVFKGSSAVLNNSISGDNTNVYGGGICLVSSSGAAISGPLAVANNAVLKGVYGNGGGIYISACDNIQLAGFLNISNNAMMTGMNGNGAAIYFTMTNFASLIGPGVFSNNAIVGANRAIISGAGLFYEYCNHAFLKGSVEISGNTIVIGSDGYGLGAGLYFIYSNYATIVGPINVTNNIVSTLGNTGSAGGLYSTSCDMMTLVGPINISGNSVSGDHAGSGGGFWIDSSNDVLLQGPIDISNNVVSKGNGGGGYISDSVIAFNDVSMDRNAASIGGGYFADAASTLTLVNCSISANVGTVAAGALCMKDSSTSLVVETTFKYNTAPTAAVMFGMLTANSTSVITARNTFIVPLGNSFYYLGNLDNANSTWNCSYPGSIFLQEKSFMHYELTCVACDSGTYAVDFASTLHANRKCQPCPFGGFCNGSSPTSNGLLALGGYWGSFNSSSGIVTFYQCPNDYCCPNNQKCPYNYCQAGRQGSLCGKCEDGSGLRFFSESCGLNADCNDQAWFSWIIILGAALGVLFLLVTTDNTNSSGITSVLLYFYQVLPLIKSTPWKYIASSEILVGIQSMFSFSPSGQYGNDKGICLMQSMTAAERLASRILMQIIIFLMLIFWYSLHFLVYHTVRPMSNRIPKTARPVAALYIATAIRFGTIAYTTLVLVPLQMLKCVGVDLRHVWWLDGSIECFQKWQIGGFVGIGMLIPVPLFVIWLLWKKWEKPELLAYEWQKKTWRMFTESFKAEKRWWLGISLYRRFLHVVVYTVIIDENWKGIASIALCNSFLALNLLMQPFKDTTTQRAETVSLAILSILSATSAPQLSQIQFGTSAAIANESAIEWTQFVLSMSPIAGFFVLCTYRAIIWVRNRVGPGEEHSGCDLEMASCYSEESSNSLDECGFRRGSERLQYC